MIELYLDPETFRTMQQFKTPKPVIGLKPLMVFSGSAFDSPVETKYTLLKSVMADFFRGQESATIDVEGLQYLVSVSVGEEGEGEQGPKVHLRMYLIKTKRSGQKLPRVEVEEMGPRMDFRIGRVKEADEDMMKMALKRSKAGEVCLTRPGSSSLMGGRLTRYCRPSPRRTWRPISSATRWAASTLADRT
jgi:ribosome production factor 2